MENEFEDEEAILGYAPNTSENPPPEDNANPPQYAPQDGVFSVNAPQNPPNGGVQRNNNALHNPAPHGGMQTFNNVVQHSAPHGNVQMYANAPPHPPHGGVQTYNNVNQNSAHGGANTYANTPEYSQQGGANAYANTNQNHQHGSASTPQNSAQSAGANTYPNMPQNPPSGANVYGNYTPQNLAQPNAYANTSQNVAPGLVNPYRNPHQPPVPQVSAIDYSTGLFDFNDINLFCVSLWLPFITFGQIAEIVDKGSSSCGVTAAIYGSICLLTYGGGNFIYSYMYGSKIKAQYGIHSDIIADICIHLWCSPCVLTQEYRELQIRGYDPALGWHGNLLKQNNPGMMAPPVPSGMTR